MIRAPKCVILDFGNVIAFFDHMQACRQLAALSSVKLSEDQIEKLHDEIFKETDLEARYDGGKLTTAAFLEELRRLFQIAREIPSDKIANAWSDMFSPNKPVLKMIPRLKVMPYKLILASNTNELHYKWFRSNPDFKDVLDSFDGEVLSFHQDVGCQKPCAEFYEKCLRIAGLKPSQCIFVDDKYENVEAAINLGMKGIEYKTPHKLFTTLQELGIPLIHPTGDEPAEERDVALAIYKQKYDTWRHLDSLRWQVPGVVFASSAVILGFARQPDGLPSRWVMVLYGIFVLMSAWLMLRIGHNLAQNNKALRSAAFTIGDHSIPKPPRRLSASNWGIIFLLMLGAISLVGGLFFRS